MTKMEIRQLIDAPYFLYPSVLTPPASVDKFLASRPLGWELRQAAELALFARYFALQHHYELLHDYYRVFAQRLTSHHLIESERQAIQDYLLRLQVISRDTVMESSVKELEKAIYNLNAANSSADNSRPSIPSLNEEVETSIERILHWSDWIQRNGKQSDRHEMDIALVPSIELCQDILNWDADFSTQYKMVEIPTGMSWRKWFVYEESGRLQSIWFRTDDTSSRARQFVWNCIHDGAHILHQSILNNSNRFSLVLGCYPLWGVSESFAMLVEHMAFNAIADENSPLVRRLNALQIDKDEVATVLIEGFIEREIRWLRSLYLATLSGSVAIWKRVNSIILEKVISGQSEFDALNPMPWYYSIGYKYLPTEQDQLLSFLRFEAEFPHPKEYTTWHNNRIL